MHIGIIKKNKPNVPIESKNLLSVALEFWFDKSVTVITFQPLKIYHLFLELFYSFFFFELNFSFWVFGVSPTLSVKTFMEEEVYKLGYS